MVKKLFPWLEEKWQILMTGLAGLVVLLLMALVFTFTQLAHRETAPATDMELLEELMSEELDEVSTDIAETSNEESKKEGAYLETAEVIVDIKGEVNAPGVYEMTVGSRVIDVIEKAGGLLKEAETTAVNFAQIVTDQMIIYIPRVGEESPDIQPLPEQELNETKAEKININQADKEALMTLNGIGSSKAENILSYREENGLFKSVEEIKNVSGIGEATFNHLKDYITVGP